MPGRRRSLLGSRWVVAVDALDERGAVASVRAAAAGGEGVRGSADLRGGAGRAGLALPAKPLRVVAGAVPGDVLLVEVERESRGLAHARLVEVIEPSPLRTAARCPIVVECGGCPWQAVRYEAQVAAKREALLARVAAVPALAGAVVGPVRELRGEQREGAGSTDPTGSTEPTRPACSTGSGPYAYRTKLQFAAAGRAGALALGLYRPGTHEVTDLRDCPVQDPEALRVLAAVRALLDRLAIAPYDERTDAGILRHVLIRVGGRGEVAVVLVARTLEGARREALAEGLAAIPAVAGAWLALAEAPGNVVLQGPCERLWGRERIRCEVAGLPFALGPLAFFQTSLRGAEALVDAVGDLAPGPLGAVVDLYAGAGLFARALAPRAAHVTAVEESPAAVADLEAGLGLGPPACPFEAVAADVAGWLREREAAATGDAAAGPPGAAGPPAPVDLVVIDPPRAGLAGGVGGAIVRALRPRRLVYVSCEPATLVRDLALLADLGYPTARIEPVDLFPHTPRLECVALAVPEAGAAGRPPGAPRPPRTGSP